MTTGDPVPNSFQQAFAEARVPDTSFNNLPRRLHLALNLAFMTLPGDELSLLLMQAEPRLLKFASGFRSEAPKPGIDLLRETRLHLIDARKGFRIAEPRVDRSGLDVGPAGNRINLAQMIDGNKVPAISAREIIAPRFHRLRKSLPGIRDRPAILKDRFDRTRVTLDPLRLLPFLA